MSFEYLIFAASLHGSIGSINQRDKKKSDPIIDSLMRYRTFAIFSVSKNNYILSNLSADLLI